MTPLAAALALLAPLCPQQSQPGIAGRIFGRVVDAREEAVVNARVEALLPPRFARTPGTKFGSTDGSGCFRIGDLMLPEGRAQEFLVQVSEPGRTRATEKVVLSKFAPRREGLVLRSYEAASVRGKVVDEQGRAVAEASIVALHDPLPEFVEAEYARSDGEGRFVLEDVLPGEWLIRAHAPGYALAEQRARVTGAWTLEVTLKKREGPRLRVELTGVTSAEQARSASLTVRVRPLGASLWLPLPRSLATIPLDEHGVGELLGLPAGKVAVTLESDLLECSKAHQTGVLVGKLPMRLDFAVEPAELVEVRGTLVDGSGRPLMRNLHLVRGGGEGLQLCLSREDGTFTFPAKLAAGTLFRPELDSQDLVLPFGRFDWLAAKPSSPLALVATAPRTLRGTVVDVGRNPVGGARVVAVRPCPRAMFSRDVPIGEATTDAAGRFEIRGLAITDAIRVAESAQVKFTGTDGDVEVRGAGLEATEYEVSARQLVLEATHATGSGSLDVDLATQGQLPCEIALEASAELEGVVRDAEGKPVPGKRIKVSHFLGTHAIVTPGPVSDREGRFKLSGLAPGKWWLGCAGNTPKDSALTATLVLEPGAKRSVELVVPVGR